MIDRSEISKSAQTLLALLSYAGEGECPVTRREIAQMWDEASDMHGFAAVGAFLKVCADLDESKES